VKKVYELDAEIERKEALLAQYSKKMRKFPKYGPRRQALEQVILLIHSEIRTLRWVVNESLKPIQPISEEAIEENSAWLK
jgi:hypothetical protein